MPAPENAAGPSGRYAVNVAWTGLGALGNFLNMALVSPIVIRTLGPEGYGVWALLFSLVGYSVFMDLGVRPALIYYTAYWTSLGQSEKVAELMNAVLTYYLLGGAALSLGFIGLSPYAPDWFHVSDAFRGQFETLVSLIGAIAVLGLNPFVASIEGLQRFDMSVKIYVVTLLARVAGSLSLLAAGFGVVALGLNYLAVQTLGITLGLIAFRRLVPSFRFIPRVRGLQQLRGVASYASQSFMVSVANVVLAQSAPLIVGRLMSADAVGFFSLPHRLMQYSGDIVVRAGAVTTTSSVETVEARDWAKLVRVGILANRLGFVLYMPIVIFLACFAGPFLTMWIGPQFSERSTPLIVLLVAAGAVAIGGQFQSSAILFALREQRRYGRALLLEAATSVAAMWLLIPRYGLLGGAIGVAVPMLAFRAGYVPWTLCRLLDHSPLRYWLSIYFSPVAAGLPVWLVARQLPTPASWLGMVGTGLGIAGAYGICAWFVCLTPDQRERLLGVAQGVWRRLRPAESTDAVGTGL